MGGTVTVACKIPNGIELQLFEAFDWVEHGPGGQTRTVKSHRPIGDSVRVKGNSAPHGVPIVTPGGYSLTTGVDADHWAAWLEQNKDSPLIKNMLIFAMPREDSAAGKARDQAEVRSGLERIDPTKPVQIGAGLTLTQNAA